MQQACAQRKDESVHILFVKIGQKFTEIFTKW